MMSIEERLSRFEKEITDPRNVLRTKLVRILDVLNPDGLTKRMIVVGFESRVSKLDVSTLKEILRIMRE